MQTQNISDIHTGQETNLTMLHINKIGVKAMWP